MVEADRYVDINQLKKRETLFKDISPGMLSISPHGVFTIEDKDNLDAPQFDAIRFSVWSGTQCLDIYLALLCYWKTKGCRLPQRYSERLEQQLIRAADTCSELGPASQDNLALNATRGFLFGSLFRDVMRIEEDHNYVQMIQRKERFLLNYLHSSVSLAKALKMRSHARI